MQVQRQDKHREDHRRHDPQGHFGHDERAAEGDRGQRSGGAKWFREKGINNGRYCAVNLYACKGYTLYVMLSDILPLVRGFIITGPMSEKLVIIYTIYYLQK